MKLYKTREGILAEQHGAVYSLSGDWDELLNQDNLKEFLEAVIREEPRLEKDEAAMLLSDDNLLPPIGSQEIWAAGVTYLKSRDARMEESQESGAASLYDRVYDAERPELFFKATPARTAGHGQQVYIRKDSAWNVPEPELTLFINSNGKIQGYTCGNDMSSRSIEGENALYLPQAKIYERSASIGPCLYVTSKPISRETAINLVIRRDGKGVFEDSTTVARIKRSFEELAGYLFRELDFPSGCYLMTGTCLVPGSDFTLQAGDLTEISIDGPGMMVNTIAYHPKHK
jgi:2-dehydro-3-deoxy-D-arabinonate dehydratase